MTKAESKKRVHELYEKHYGKGKKKSKAAKQKEVVAEKVAVEQKAVAEKRGHGLKGQSRADLMLQAKEKGIKNFRVLNKEELVKILAPEATEESIAQVVQGAVARWKSGWGSKGGRSATQAA